MMLGRVIKYLADDVDLNLYNPKDRWSGDGRGSIKVCLVEQAAVTATGGAIALARDVLESARITTSADSALVVGDTSGLTDSAANLATIMSKLTALGNILDAISRVRQQQQQNSRSSLICAHI
jgi:hypothetical protein